MTDSRLLLLVSGGGAIRSITVLPRLAGIRGSAVGVGELADGSGSGSVEWKASQPFGWDGQLERVGPPLLFYGGN